MGGHAVEVREVGTNGALAAKPKAVELAAPEVLPERRLGGSGVVAVLASEDGLATKCALHNSYVDASERQLRAIDIGSR